MKYFLLALTLLTPIVEDHRGPPPIPERYKSCLRVVGFPVCISVEDEVLRLYGLTCGETMKVTEMLEIDEENRNFKEWRKRN